MSEQHKAIEGDAEEEIYQLVYVSAATVPFSQADLEQLLSRARVNNASLDITGVLLFIDGTFFQVLEGSQENVNSLYEQIELDERHIEKLVLVRRIIPQRNFAEWRMGFVNDEQAICQLPGFVDFFADGHRSFLDLRGDSKRIKEVIEGFHRGRWRRHAELVS
ncbi:MAG: BLUF domain-containing protein [Planctomycetales bacterium]|nr:BLUF domain-containing protein [Planctomycetales bacterium]